MNLDQLLYQQQVAIINESAAARDPRAGSRFCMVEHYGKRICALKSRLGVSQYPDWVTSPALRWFEKL